MKLNYSLLKLLIYHKTSHLILIYLNISQEEAEALQKKSEKINLLIIKASSMYPVLYMSCQTMNLSQDCQVRNVSIFALFATLCSFLAFCSVRIFRNVLKLRLAGIAIFKQPSGNTGQLISITSCQYYLVFHHSCNYVPCMNINGDQSTQNVSCQFRKFTTNQCCKLVQILSKKQTKKTKKVNNCQDDDLFLGQETYYYTLLRKTS